MPRKKIGLLLVAGLLALSGTGGVTAMSTAKPSAQCTKAKQKLAAAQKGKASPAQIKRLQKDVKTKCAKK